MEGLCHIIHCCKKRNQLNICCQYVTPNGVMELVCRDVALRCLFILQYNEDNAIIQRRDAVIRRLYKIWATTRDRPYDYGFIL